MADVEIDQFGKCGFDAERQQVDEACRFRFFLQLVCIDKKPCQSRWNVGFDSAFAGAIRACENA